jgi:hypothetical protein
MKAEERLLSDIDGRNSDAIRGVLPATAEKLTYFDKVLPPVEASTHSENVR